MHGRFPSRFVTVKALAAFLCVSMSTVRHWKGATAPPRTALGTFDTWNPAFQAWLDTKLGWQGAGAASAYRPESQPEWGIRERKMA